MSKPLATKVSTPLSENVHAHDEASLACQGAVMSGPGSVGMSPSHVAHQLLEMLAVFSIETISPRPARPSYTGSSDNTLVVSYYKKQTPSWWSRFGRSLVEPRWTFANHGYYKVDDATPHPPPPLVRSVLFPKHSFFPDVYYVYIYIADIFIKIYILVPVRHVDNNIYLQHTLSLTKNVRRYIFSGLLKLALLEKIKKIQLQHFFSLMI